MKVDIHTHIDTVDPAEWDSLLAPHDLQATHRFVKLCQDSGIEDSSYRHLLFRQDGKLAAIASLCRMTVNLDVLAPPKLRRGAGIARRVVPYLMRLPTLFCGLPVSFGQSCVRFAPRVDRAVVMNTLAGLMNELAQQLNTGLLCLKEFNEQERTDCDSLVKDGFLRLPSLPSCSIGVQWQSFDAYLSAMRSGYRRQMRLDDEHARRIGLRVSRVADVGRDSATLHRLYRNVIDRTEFVLERLPQTFFEKLSSGLGEDVGAVFLTRDDVLVAYAIILRGPQTLTYLLAGIDDRANRECHLHPLLVSGVIAEAIHTRASTIELGQTAYALKGRFGARLARRYLYLRHRSPVAQRALRLASKALFPERQFVERRVFRHDSPEARSTTPSHHARAGY